MAGDESAARTCNEELQALNEALFLESNPIPVKWALARRGLIGKGIRLPLTELAQPYHAPLEAALQALGLL